MRDSLAELTEAYQVQLEAVRAHPFNDHLEEDLKKAERELEIALIERDWEAE